MGLVLQKCDQPPAAFRSCRAPKQTADVKPIDRPDEVQGYYRDGTVVDQYLRRRTAQPLNGFLHRCQVCFLTRALRERAPAQVLEIAPGPARLTAELELPPSTVVVDTSAEMLAVARRRLRARGRGYTLLQGDAFTLPFASRSFDFVCALKLIRHFQIDDRRRLYAEILRVLKPGGAFTLDAQNRAVSLPHRQRKGLESYPVYDVLYDPAELVAELETAGFRILRLKGMVKHFAVQRRLNRLRRFGLAGAGSALIRIVEHIPSKAPSTWMVLSEARG
jgi:ubiquinone/menaquinone biosynthesis C-methylase UbiE